MALKVMISFLWLVFVPAQSLLLNSKGKSQQLTLNCTVYSVHDGIESSLGALVGVTTDESTFPEHTPENDPDFTLINATLRLELKEVNPICCKECARSSVKSHLFGPSWAQLVLPERNHTTSGVTALCPNTPASLCSWLRTDDFCPITTEILQLNHHCHGNSLLNIDLEPVVQRWIYKNGDCYDRSMKATLIFSLVIDTKMRIKDYSGRDAGSNLSTSATTFESIVIGQPSINFHYFLDHRCHVTGADICAHGACANEDQICKFRSYCPETDCGISCDFEEPCKWKWDEGHPGFQLLTGQDVSDTRARLADPNYEYSGPHMDARNNSNGHFLLLLFTNNVNLSAVYHLKSPWFSQSDGSCYLEAILHMRNMQEGSFKLVMHTRDHTTWVPLTQLGNDKNMWERLKINIGKTNQPFQISLEVTPSPKIPSHIAIDNIRLVNCFPKPAAAPKQFCSATEFRCRNDLCINRTEVCDFSKDCPNGEDEELDCDKMPVNTTCDFEKGWCGWTNVSESNIRWERKNKPSGSKITGPTSGDHTFHDSRNHTGYYLYVDMNAKNSQILDKAMLRSPIYAPPPFYHQDTSSNYYNSCQLRFFYHMFGPHMGSLHVEVIELKRKFPRSTRLLTISRDQGNIWHRASRPLPKLDNMYYIEFVATRGARFAGDIALDDISLSPECVGLGVPSKELRGYSYDTLMSKPRDQPQNNYTVITMDMKNVTKYIFTTCGNSGRLGPSPEQCENTYRDTPLNSSVRVLTEEGREGFQVWTVPKSSHYTFVAKGASGGRGAVINQMASHGSIVKVTLYLRQGEQIYVVVGQEGTSVCDQKNVTLPEKLRDVCARNMPQSLIGRIIRSPKGSDALAELHRINTLLGGGGGGGGATFVFKMDGATATAILVAAGGGGLAYNASPNIPPYGKGTNTTLESRSGSSLPHGAGGGGGWKGSVVPTNVDVVGSLNDVTRLLGGQMRDRQKDNLTMWISAGGSALDGGAHGGLPCVDSANWGTVGGFGGGGGGCTAGGAGGGFVGGNAHNGLSSNGEGGLSFVTKGGMYPSVEPGGHDGPGSLVVIPSVFKGCGCEYHCLLLDEFRFHAACVCPENEVLTEDGYGCMVRETKIPVPYLWGLIVLGIVLFAVVGLLCIFLYNRYQRQKAAMLRRKVLGGPELQLSRLRAASGPGGVLTEYNPNYEFGGETYNLTDLKEIPREVLRLVKALGQGAFGEVYQGFYKHRAGDAVEMPVAVKTLPELSSNQAEMDFLMEALIMSKFNHPNIVHFIGVCFDKHPRFIILELLAGGDLKTFLRGSRPKPERASPLQMKDLLLCAMDVAKGCKYLEENHFIHRDIAARNCLLTTKGPGRVVKIADFGMARDIYRADYYKKGGKAMLPVKWMPPEAFLDGIFTSKTDVWSYGVLLWEVLSLGYMPYPGRGNQDVMMLVTNGGRLEPPSNCPPPVYGIMTQCWHPIPEERPNFCTLLERVGYCLQDPEVVNAPLPVFQRPPSSERDTTLMRPLNPDDQSCLRVVHGHRSSNATSLSTVPPSPSSAKDDYLVPLTPYSFSSSHRANGGTDSVVRSPTSPTSPSPIPESESTQTLLDDEEDDDGTRASSTSKRLTSNGNSGPIHLYDPSKGPGRANQRKIENGLTLNPAALDAKSRKPVPYVNVGVKKSDKKPDIEEIKC